MCGIAGIINFRHPKDHIDALCRMTQSLTHRGPDDEGYVLFSDNAESFFGDDSLLKNTTHIQQATSRTFKVGLGFRQLKIIDLSHKSHQPMTDETQRYWIVYNGEVYNYKEIRSELQGLGYSFFSTSDSEVVLKSYIHWGKDALHKFNGMFAFAIYDQKEAQLFMARDRIGIKPLYYYHHNGLFVFGSTIQSIISSHCYTPEVNWEGLSQNFRFSIAQRPTTSFKNIYAVPPAHYQHIDCNTGALTQQQYWEIPISTQAHNLSFTDAKDALEEALHKAITYRLRADVSVGTFMSGGIDSSLITALAAKNTTNLKALTLGFTDYAQYNEIEEATATAKMYPIAHHIHSISSSEVLQHIHQTVIAYEEPYFHLSANFVLANMASQHNLKVVLSGLGGDELFGGYDVFYKIPYWKKLQKLHPFIQVLPNIHQKVQKGKQLAAYNSLSDYYAHYYTNYSDVTIQRLFKNNAYSTKNTIANYYQKEHQFTDVFETMSYFSLKSYIGNHQMRAVDHSTMAFSIEGRFPLLDHELITTAFKIPTQFKIQGSTQKYILKELARKYISPKTMEMSKKGLTLPLREWIDTELKDFVMDTIAQLQNRTIFNNKTISDILASKQATKIWQLVATELWFQNFIDRS